MTNQEWIELIKKEFQVNGSVARKMLHAMMEIKTIDKIVKGRKDEKIRVE